MTQIWTVQNGQLVRRIGAAGSQYEGYLPPILVRPTGADYVRYEDLVQGTDDVTVTTEGGQVVRRFGPGVFQTVIERCPANKWITFPAGVFEINTPGWNIGDATACQWPKTSYGAIGNYPPGDSWNNLAPDDKRTVFRVKEYTARADRNVAGSWFKAGYTGSVKQTWANIHFEGTEQGFQSTSASDYNGVNGNDGTSRKIFTNAFFWQLADDSSARDILSTGNFGNHGAPPGESFSFQWYHSTNPVLCRVNVDGRRAAGGKIYSSAGMTFGNTLNGVMNSCYAHHTGRSAVVFFQTANCRSYNCVLGDDNDRTTQHVSTNVSGNVLNHERTTGNIHTDMALNCYPVDRPALEHVTHSNDNWTLVRSGQSIPIDNGTLKMINQTHSKILFSEMGYPMAIGTWVPYSLNQGVTSNSMTVDNRPIIVASDGVTPVMTRWNYGGTWYTI